MTWYNKQDTASQAESGSGQSSLVQSGQVGECHVSRVSGGRGIIAPASPSPNFTDNRIHLYSLLQSRHCRGYRLPEIIFIGGCDLWQAEWKGWKRGGNCAVILSHIVSLWTRFGANSARQLTVSKNLTTKAALTLSSGPRNIWNAPAAAPQESRTPSTTTNPLRHVTAANPTAITASVPTLADVLSPAPKLPVSARAGGFPMSINRFSADRRLYYTDRICQLEFKPIDAPCFVVIALIHWRLDVESGRCRWLYNFVGNW